MKEFWFSLGAWVGALGTLIMWFVAGDNEMLMGVLSALLVVVLPILTILLAPSPKR